MKKNVLQTLMLGIAAFLAIGLLTACSSRDDVGQEKTDSNNDIQEQADPNLSQEDVTDPNEKTGEPDDMGTPDVNDSIRFDYRLLNEKGEEATEFNEGENIVFDLTVYNDGNDEVTLDKEEIDLVCSATRVYTKDGLYYGSPWDDINIIDIPERMYWIIIDANGQKHWSYPWTYNKDYVVNAPLGSWELGQMSIKDPLSKGNYYAELNFRFREIDKTISKRIDFRVK